jgi:hypothetical protein
MGSTSPRSARPVVALLIRARCSAFDQHLHGAVGQLEHLQDGGDAADVVEVLGLGLVLGGGLLGHQHDALARLHRGLERLDGLGSPDEQRDDHVREHHHIAQGQQRHLEGFGGKEGGVLTYRF